MRMRQRLVFLVLLLLLAGFACAATNGPFTIYSPDSSSSLRFQFAGQLRMLYENKDFGPDKDRDDRLYMEARRLRVTLAGTIKLPRLSYRLHLSAAPNSLEVMDFYFNYENRKGMQFRVGQYKTPFTRYRIQSFQRLTFADWALVTKYFGSERQMGFSLHNGYEKPPRWGYVVGIFTGVNARASHAVGLGKFFDVEIDNPSNLADAGDKAEFHPELFIHASYNAKDISVQSDSDDDPAGFRYSIAFSASWDIDPDPLRDLAARLAPECLVKYRGWSASVIGYAGFIKLADKIESDPALVGLLAQTAYRINRTYELSARFAAVEVEDVLMNSAELADIMVGDSNAGQLWREKEMTVGFNVYFLGHSLKWQNDIGRVEKTSRTKVRVDYVGRSQFQVTF